MKSKREQELINTLTQEHKDIVNFKLNGEEYYKNTKLRDFLNKLFSANIQSVYSVTKNYDLKHGLD